MTHSIRLTPSKKKKRGGGTKRETLLPDDHFRNRKGVLNKILRGLNFCLFYWFSIFDIEQNGFYFVFFLALVLPRPV